MRRKGLALLAYLALDGPARRDALADLLWGTENGRGNLRVELRRLNVAFGRDLQGRGADPLELPGWLEVRIGGAPHDFLRSMEDLTPHFDEWLVVQRERMAAEAEPFTGTHAWVDKLASMLPASAVVLLRVTPATDGRAEAQVLATALRRQLLEGPEVGSRPSVRLLPPPFDDGQARAVARDGESIWVVPLPAYGEEPLCVLEMRSMLRPERLFEVEVPPLSWPVARSDVLSELPFERAAPIYLQSGGNASFLAELMESGPDVLPPRIHAAYLWEARHASLDARLALERLSVHPGPLPWTLIEVFEAQPSLDELERRGWLAFDAGWRFADPVARRIVDLGLQPGRRQHFHLLAAEALEREGMALAALYHRREAGAVVDWEGAEASLTPWARQALRACRGGSAAPARAARSAGWDGHTSPLVTGAELALLEELRYGGTVYGDGPRWSIVRTGDEASPSGAVFETPVEPLVLRVRGRGFVDSPLNVGLDGESAALSLRHDGVLRAVFVAGLREPKEIEGVAVVPLATSFETWLRLDPGSRLRVESSALMGVIELEMAIFREGADGRERRGRQARMWGGTGA
ncbi:MAG: hypothetical protein P8Y02_09780 [Deinococcales bacterium]